MDFPAPPPSYSLHESQERTWRRAWIVTAAIAALELVALLVIALAFIAKPFADGAASKAAETAAGGQQPQATAALLPRPKTPVLVLNGNGVAGAAGSTARRVRKLDYPVVSVGNASRRSFARTIVMYAPGARAAGVRLARDLGIPARRAVPLDGMRPSELDGAQVAVIVGRS